MNENKKSDYRIDHQTDGQDPEQNNPSVKQSRRSFLIAGGGAVAAASIIAVRAPGAYAAVTNPNPVMANDPVYTESAQTLTNKTIRSLSNNLVVGTDAVNVREFAISGSDITSALNSAISYLSGGGRIYVPRGLWTSNGNHQLTNSISVEGAGFNLNPNIYGTEIKLNAGGADAMFVISAPLVIDPNTNQPTLNGWSNISIKNLGINLQNKATATGLLLTNAAGGAIIYATAVENVGFNGGAYGIRTNSVGSTHFECILNRFERCSFIGCAAAFSCNSINGGYAFDNCYFSAPPNGIALDCISIGNLALKHCLFVCNATTANDSTILKTINAYNNISFYDCQDEGFTYMYRNGLNYYLEVPIVFRNCLIQSKFKYTATGSVIFDSCWINVTGAANGIIFEDYPGSTPGPNPFINVYLKGLNNIYKSTSVGKLTGFTRPYSRVIYESNAIGEPFIAQPTPVAPSTASYDVTNSSRGVIIIPAGSQSRLVYNNLLYEFDTVIFTQLLSYDANGARIREVIRGNDYFTINLTQNAANELRVAFRIEA